MSVPPFFRVIGFTVEPHAHNITQRKGGQEASLVVLPSDEAQCHLKFRDIIRIGVVHLWWYVATVYAIKLRHNIFSATRTIHIFCDQTSFVVLSESPVFIVVLSKSRLCARPFGKKTTGFPLDFFRLSGWRRDEARQKRRELRPKGRSRLFSSCDCFFFHDAMSVDFHSSLTRCS